MTWRPVAPKCRYCGDYHHSANGACNFTHKPMTDTPRPVPQEQDDSLLGTAASGNPTDPPSTPQRLWRGESWRPTPEAFDVMSATAKTYTVRSLETKGVLPHWTVKVRHADIGVSWFYDEVSAWHSMLRAARSASDHAKQELQRRRTRVGMLESEMRRRGIGVDGGAQGDTHA